MERMVVQITVNRPECEEECDDIECIKCWNYHMDPDGCFANAV